MRWVDSFPQGPVKLIGAAEVIGAIGLVVPGLTNIAPILVPIAAAALTVLMIGAAITHIRRREGPVLPIVLVVLSAIIAIGRFWLLPF